MTRYYANPYIEAVQVDANTYSITLNNGNTRNIPAAIFETLFSVAPDQPIPEPIPKSPQVTRKENK